MSEGLSASVVGNRAAWIEEHEVGWRLSPLSEHFKGDGVVQTGYEELVVARVSPSASRERRRSRGRRPARRPARARARRARSGPRRSSCASFRSRSIVPATQRFTIEVELTVVALALAPRAVSRPPPRRGRGSPRSRPRCGAWACTGGEGPGARGELRRVDACPSSLTPRRLVCRGGDPLRGSHRAGGSVTKAIVWMLGGLGRRRRALLAVAQAASSHRDLVQRAGGVGGGARGAGAGRHGRRGGRRTRGGPVSSGAISAATRGDRARARRRTSDGLPIEPVPRKTGTRPSPRCATPSSEIGGNDRLQRHQERQEAGRRRDDACGRRVRGRGADDHGRIVVRRDPLARTTRSPFSPDEVRILEDVTPPVTTAVANALAFEEIEKLRSQVEDENLALQEEIAATAAAGGIIGASPGLLEALERVSRVAATDSTVLITGETGTGKELVAGAIHQGSPRARRALVEGQLRCAAAGLVASELFGHGRGVHRRPRTAGGAASSWRRGALSSSTRWGSCRRRCRSPCCACCRSASSSGWAAARRCGRTPRDSGHEPGPGGSGARGEVPLRPLPSGRVPDPGAAAAAAGRGHPRCRRPLREPCARQVGKAVRGIGESAMAALCAYRLARATSASCRTWSNVR